MKLPKRFRFSLRSLLAAITIACVLLGTWRLWERRAISDVAESTGGTPLVVFPYVFRVVKSDNVTVNSTLHVWCFGLTLDLPYWSRSPETEGFVSGGVRPRLISQQVDGEMLEVGTEE